MSATCPDLISQLDLEVGRWWMLHHRRPATVNTKCFSIFYHVVVNFLGIKIFEKLSDVSMIKVLACSLYFE